MKEIPKYALRAYALFYSKYGSRETFKQSELDWVVSESMRKKIFSILLNSGWIEKESKTEYKCKEPQEIFTRLLDFKVPEIIKRAEKPYAFTKLSAVEIWSDYSYVQRSRKKSPYFIKILEKDLDYWKNFFHEHDIPVYVKEGSTIGEYIILIPVKRITFEKKQDYKVEKFNNTMRIAEKNENYKYAYDYMRDKYA